MIYYFSATGNNKYLAEQIAQSENMQATSIQGYDGNINEQDEIIGIVAPTYFWGLPKIVSGFLNQIKVEKAKYIFYVTTYGTTPGKSYEFAREILAKRNIELSAMYSVKMPDVWTPIFDLSNKEKVNRQNQMAEKQLDDICRLIEKRAKGNFVNDRFVPKIIAKAYNSHGLKESTKTSHLHVGDTYIGCGLCAKKCPADAIEMVDGKPTWIKPECEMCLGCLHRCPKFAIQYDNKTQKHGQYRHPNTKI